MKTKYIALCVLVVVAAGVVVIAAKKEHVALPVSVPVVQPKPVLTDTQQPTDLVVAHNVFGFDIFKTISASGQGTNVFISPTSLSLALSMVYNGASSTTRTAMAKTLHVSNLSLDSVNKQSAGLLNEMQNPDPKVNLAIADSVWARQGVSFNQGFLDTVNKYFGAKTSVLDFADPASVNTINSWVSDNTNGKIPRIVDHLSHDLVMYLINAVYFKGSWTHAFERSLTENRDFTLAGGSTIKNPAMTMHREDFQYLENSGFQSVSLPYGNNQRLAMYVFLPKGDLDTFVGSVDQKTFDSWMPQYQSSTGTVYLPKFKIEYQRTLNRDLSALGMGEAFGDSADLSGIGHDLMISEVVHKTYVDVNEEGTEAAAVTGIGVATSAIMQPVQEFTMDVNKPFFFVIRDTRTGEILFMGSIQNPKG